MSKNSKTLVISATIAVISAIVAFGMFLTTATVNAQLPGMNPTEDTTGNTTGAAQPAASSSSSSSSLQSPASSALI